MLKRRRTEQDELLASPPAERPASIPERRKRRRNPRRRYLIFLGVLGGIALAAYLGMTVLLNAEDLRPKVEAALSRTLGRATRIGALKFTLGFGGLIATDVTVAEDPAFGSAPFLHAQRVELGVSRLSLVFRQEMQFDAIYLEQPSVTLIRGASEKWNYYSMLTAGATPPAISSGPRVRVDKGILTIRGSDRGEPVVLRDVALDVPRFATAAESAFSLSAAVAGGGRMKVNGKAGPLIWNRGVPAAPMSLLVNARKISIEESNLASSIAPALAGSLSLDGTVESDGNTLQVNGNSRISGLKLARSAAPALYAMQFAFSLEHDLATRSGSLTRCDVQFEKGSASLEGRYTDAEGGAMVKLDFKARGVPVAPLAGLLPAISVPLPAGSALQQGLAFMDMEIQGPLDHPTTSGSIDLKNARLTGFDLEEKLSSVSGLDLLHISRDLEINSLTAKFESGGGKIVVNGLELELPELGTMSGNGVIGDDRMLDFQMNAIRTGVAEKRPIPFSVHGACTAPIFRQPGKTG